MLLALVRSVALVSFLLIFLGDLSAQTLSVTSSNDVGGPTATALAQNIIDENSSYTLVSGSVTTAINAAGNPNSSPRAMASFQNGMVAPGTPLPAANNVTPQKTYAGGIGVLEGVCLCTGAASDSDSAGTGSPGRGIGVQGPNNGEHGFHPGEIYVALFGTSTIDDDFNQHVFGGSIDSGSSDPTVLEFQITQQYLLASMA